MNKYNNPRLLNAVVSGTGMKHPIQPHVVVGDESNGFIRGDLMDANAIVDLVNSILHPKEEDPYNGHEYVDLSLPSGTKWAKMNVGANSEKDAGLYFAWGETQGYTASQVGTDKQFQFEDYKFFHQDGSTPGLTKYNETDGLTHLELTDDAANVNMGGDWHMPNIAQYLELLKETKNGFVTNAGAFTQYAWDDQNREIIPTQTTATVNDWSTAGWLFFKSNVTDINTAISSGEYIFIPASGNASNGNIDGVGAIGEVWTLARVSNTYIKAFCYDFFAGAATIFSNDRCYGNPVRGVVGEMDETEWDKAGHEVTPQPIS